MSYEWVKDDKPLPPPQLDERMAARIKIDQYLQDLHCTMWMQWEIAKDTRRPHAVQFVMDLLTDLGYLPKEGGPAERWVVEVLQWGQDEWRQSGAYVPGEFPSEIEALRAWAALERYVRFRKLDPNE